MAVLDLYHRRINSGNLPDVYIYDSLTIKFKNQFIHMCDEIVGKDPVYNSYNDPKIKFKMVFYKKAYKIIIKEFGLESLVPSIRNNPHKGYFDEISEYFRNSELVDYNLSLIEIIIRLFEEQIEYERYIEFIEELNQRFFENAIGYQYENGQIIRVDSQLIHSEVVKPALQLLSDKMYQGAQDEFLKAHEFYRNQNYKNMMVECLKAYESTLKIII